MRALLLLLVFSASVVRAQEPVVWHCWYEADGKFQLTCVQPESASFEHAAFGDERRSSLRARWHDQLAAGELAQAARLVRAHPDAFAGPRLYIPLYAHPEGDLSFARRLARAAMCGRQPGCMLAFDSTW